MKLLLLVLLAQDLATLSQRAASAMRSGDFPVAIATYRDLAKRDPANAAWRMNLGLALHSAQRYSEAIPEFESYLKTAPSPGPIHFVLGLSHLKLNQPCPARNALELAYRWNPQQVRLDLADSRAGCKIWEPAARLYIEVSKLRPNDTRLQRQIAHCLWQARLYPEALTYFDKLTAAYPSEAAFHYEMGDSLARSSGAQSGLASLQKAVELAPGLLPAQGELGKAYLALDQPENAIPHLLRAAPAIPELYLPLSRAHKARNQPDEAARAEAEYRKRLAAP
jgi:protein O-GlcNAc transferase